MRRLRYGLAVAAAAIAASVAGTAVLAEVVKARPATQEVVSGFRMEGAAQVEVVFGDAQSYRRHVDRFYELSASMDERRGAFGRHVKAALGVLSERRRGPCPAEALAVHYYRAHTAGERYKELGAALEGEYQAITRLDGLGESAGLTPDYRWKVNRVERIYRAALVDYREMRASMTEQLGGELRHRRCRTDALLSRGERDARHAALADAPDAPAVPPVTRPVSRRPGPARPAPIVASPVTFFVDNRGCTADLAVYVDGAAAGSVKAGAKAAFQSTAGRHSLCLLADGSGQSCGQKGTVRSAYIHDGWSVTMHCE
jgi:hypothetical protein